MSTCSRIIVGFIGAAIATASLFSQELRYGAQVTVTLPTSDLGDKSYLDSTLGYGMGLHCSIGFPGGHAVVPRADYLYFEQSDPTRKAQILQIGADYNFYFSGVAHKGPYLGAGAGVGATKFEITRGAMSTDDTPKSVYSAVSAGWMFTPRLGTELRYVYAKYRPELFGEKSDVVSPTVNLTFICRY